MSNYSLSHLADSSVTRGLAEYTDRDRATTAQLLAYYAEFEARRLYQPAAHPSMFSYCVNVLRVSEDTAARRIRAARAARKYPAINVQHERTVEKFARI